MEKLRLGSKGSDVGRVQEALNERMLPPNNTITRPPMAALVVDNNFGGKTKSMVMEFQRLNGIMVDGIVGPDTHYLLFPYLTFTTQIFGRGPLRGVEHGVPLRARHGATPNLMLQMARRFPLLATPVATPPGRLAVGDGDDKEEKEPEGVGVEATVGPGLKREFRPWFVLKPEEPEGPQSFTTVTAEATVLRKKGFEFGGELEFARKIGVSDSHWEWEGTLFGKYTRFKTGIGPLTVGLGPVVEAVVKEGMKVEAAVSGEAEASLELSKELLELSVGGKAGAKWDVNEGNIIVGSEITANLKLKWDVVRFPKKK